MGHIERRVRNGRKTYRARYRDPTKRERVRTFARRIDAERFLATVQADMLRGAWADPQLGRIRRAVRHSLAGRQDTAAQTQDRRHLRGPVAHPRAARARPPAPRPARPADHPGMGGRHGRLRPVASRTRQAHALLGEVLAAAVAGNYLARSPCQGIDLPRLPQTEMAFLDAAQVSRLAQAADPYASLVEVLCYCGLRWGKAIALKRRRCDLLRGRLEIAESVVEVRARPIWGPPKNHQTRTVSLPGFVRDHLAERLAGIASPDGLVWTASRGGVLRLANWRCRVWLPALEQAGLSAMRIHDCRHTAAALMIATGAHPKAVHTALGHASIAITMDRYGHLYGDELDRIAAALDAAHRDDAQRSATQTRPTSTPRVIPLPNSPAQQGGGRS